MGIVELIRKAFGVRVTRYNALTLKAGTFQFLGRPTGDVDFLEGILMEGLKHDSGLKRAFLTMMHCDGESKDRLALCLDTATSSKQVVALLAQHCAPYISSIDIIFFADLTQWDIDRLKTSLEAFYKVASE